MSREFWGTGRSSPAYLCYHPNASNNGCSLGLSPTHPTEPGGDEDLPGQVLEAQVPPTSVQHSEL